MFIVFQPAFGLKHSFHDQPGKLWRKNDHGLSKLVGIQPLKKPRLDGGLPNKNGDWSSKNMCMVDRRGKKTMSTYVMIIAI